MLAAQHSAPSSRDLPGLGREKSRLWLDLLLWCALLAGVISCVAGVYHAIYRSQDFQWSGERLLLQHVDPWRDYLLGDPAHGLIATQVPNYLPVLYVLLVPFGLMPAHAANLTFALCNALLAVASCVITARFYGFRSPRGIAAITAVMLASSPTRVTIANGQQGLLIVALWSVALLHTSGVTRRHAMSAGISYLKYSFAPALAMFLLLRDGVNRGLRVLLWSLVPCAAATLLVWCWLTGGHDSRSLLSLVVEPLNVTRVGYQPTGDPLQTFMDLFEALMGGGPVGTPRLTAISLMVAVSMTAAVLLLAFQTRFGKGHEAETDRIGWIVALMSTMSFVFYKHHPYDRVVFLFPLCYALRHWRRPAAMATLFLIGYCWFVQPSVDLRITFSLAWCAARILILFALILCVYRIAEPGEPQAEAAF